MKVFVVSHEGKPLMPTTPRRARLWLKARRARVVSREPFSIQLRFQTTDYTQPVTVGVDTGSQYELVESKGQIGYIGARRLKGSFVVKDLASGKTLLEVAPSKLERLVRPSHGWIIFSVCDPPIVT